MLSQRSHYALRAMLVLAAHDSDVPMQSLQIAKVAKLSPRFLELILLELKKAGILRSFRGCKGGFVLARPAKDISFADIIDVTDGSLALSPCAAEHGGVPCEDCFGESHCEMRRALRAARDVTDNVLRSYDLAGAALRMRRVGAL